MICVTFWKMIFWSDLILMELKPQAACSPAWRLLAGSASSMVPGVWGQHQETSPQGTNFPGKSKQGESVCLKGQYG